MRRASLMLAMLIAASNALATGASAKPPIKLDILLNKISSEKNQIGILNAAITVTPSRTLLIEDADRFYQVAWGGVRPIDGSSGLNYFDYTSDGIFMGIRGGDLMYLSPKEGLKVLAPLPSSGMGMAIGRGKIYLFERGGGERNGLYVLYPGKKIAHLFDSPEPIDAVLEAGKRVLFSAGNGIYELSADKKMKVLVALPKGRRVVSLALDPKTQKIYASDGGSVFSFKGDHVNLITKDSGGVLRWFDKGLIVFDAKSPLLVLIVGLP